MLLLCDRPHEKEVDFNDVTARFIVTKSCGINVYGQHLELGDEVPIGVLNAEALRQMYATPSCLIDTLEFAVQDPQLKEHILARGVDITLAEKPVSEPEPEAAELCTVCGKFVVSLEAHTETECLENQVPDQKPVVKAKRKR